MKRKRVVFLVTILAAACLLIPPHVSAAGATDAEIDYDQLNALGLQLLNNGSFEEMHRDGVHPADWGVVSDTMDRFKVVTDVNTSKHGATYVTYSPDRTRHLYGILNGTPSGKLRMTVWAKGHGQMAFLMRMRAKRWELKGVNFREPRSSPPFTVDTDQWKKYTYEFDMPEQTEVNGELEKPERVTVQISVTGSIALDECSVVSVEELAKQDAKRKGPASTPSDSPPFFTMPRLSTPPTIDGQITHEEWSGAAAVTGFIQLNTRRLASRQTTVYAGFDDAHLYFAFRCPHEGKLGQGTTARDERIDSQTEAIEIWMQPPDRQWYHFMGAPAGGIIDHAEKEGIPWSASWNFKNKVEESGETTGGILLFAKKIWTAEVAVPFKDLGIPTPKDGEVWRINFCRDFSVLPGKKRLSDDWTSWSPIAGAFKDSKQFGTVSFRKDAPAVQFRKLGDLENGDLSIHGLCGHKKGMVRIEARTILTENGKTVSFRSEDVHIQPDADAEFALSDTLKVAGATDAQFRLTATEPDSRTLLARSTIPFTAAAALRVKLIPILSRKVLYVNVDASRIADLPPQFDIEAQIFRNNANTGLAASARWSSERPQGDLKLDIANLPPHDYQVKVFLKELPSKKVLASSVASFCVPEKPEWLGSTIGVSDEVPNPWKAIAVDDHRLTITQREYHLNDIGLPEQVVALDEPIFAASPRLKLVLDGKETPWNCQPLTLLHKRANQAMWRIKAEAGPLHLDGRLTAEFDGFVLWDVSIRSDEPVTIDSLAMEFPFKRERSLYARGHNAATDDGAYYVCLYHREKPSDVEICGRHFGPSGWAWPHTWVHDMWIGDDRRGFSVMCETQEYIRGEKRTDIEQTENANTLKIHLVDGPYIIHQPLLYKYAWQATPVRPRPTNPKLWHACYNRGIKDEAFVKRVYVTLDMWALKYISYPELYTTKTAIEKRNAPYREYGVNIVPYFCTQRGTTDASELKPFTPEWEKYPVRTLGGIRGGSILTCLTSSFSDFVVYASQKIVDDLGFDGLYLDVSRVHACTNHYHGCGYKSATRHEWQPTVNIFASREVYKRMYNVMKSNGRNRVIFMHGMPVAAFAGFVDVVTQGEDWCREAKNQYDRLTPDIFRAKEMRIQYGPPYTWYTFHHYYRGEKFGGRVPLDAILTYCLPHRVLPTEGRPAMWPVWDLMDQWWTTSEFIPYWDPTTPININKENVLGSVYLKRNEKKALLVVANWNTEPCTVDVAIDLSKIGLSIKGLTLTRALKHPVRQPKDPPVEHPMPDNPLILHDGTLTLSLSPRNLEVLLLSSP